MNPTSARIIGVCCLIVLGTLATPLTRVDRAQADERTPSVEFNRAIRSLFAQKCVLCHGPDEAEGGLRLDRRDGALAQLESGRRAIVPDDPDASELLRRVAAADDAERMPPEGDPLSQDEVDLLRHWIATGAEWELHWAYRPVGRHMPPSVSNAAGVKSPIDCFVLEQLESRDIEPSIEADRYTLIKRLYYDLLGLPPDPQAVETFVNDIHPNAYGRLVDRILASPHFGERWGRHWLDKARYADSDGYEKDTARPNAWRYRDWVIDAINADMPFDQFTIQQLAGDQLSDATPMQKLATAFHRQTLTNTEGGTDQEEFRVEAVLDRTNTLGTVWLGLTVGCAQCHSHKYDQISQHEYYRLFAFFNNGEEAYTQVSVSDAARWHFEEQMIAYRTLKASLLNELAAKKSGLTAAFEQWLDESRDKLKRMDRARFVPISITQIQSKEGQTFQQLADGSYRVTGINPNTDDYTVIAEVNCKSITGFRIDVLADDFLPFKGPGRNRTGALMLSELQVYGSESPHFDEVFPIKLHDPIADYEHPDYGVSKAIDDVTTTAWGISPQEGKDHFAVFRTVEPITVKPDTGDGTIFLKFVLQQRYGGGHNIGRFRIQAMRGTQLDWGIPIQIGEMLLATESDLGPSQQDELLTFYAGIDPHTGDLVKRIDDLEKERPEEPLMQVRVISKNPTSRPTHVLIRGDFLRPGDEILPGTLAALHPFEPEMSGVGRDRLNFARWLVRPDNPLTPRVTVNHIWAHLFGKGLVHTMNDFGVRGKRPTHPKLLDWLAARYVGSGWSRKTMIRRIVQSATYRQWSRHRAQLTRVDPRNEWLARQNRFRVSSEVVRDIYLAASDLLTRKIGGPSVFPPMPAEIAELSYANNFSWKTSQGDQRYRRGIYTFFKRTAPHPNLMTFDCPDANTTNVRRDRSNTPLQALTTLNNEIYLEAAQSMAKRLLITDLESDTERFDYGFRLCVARSPTSLERDAFLHLLGTAREWYDAHETDADELIGSYLVDGRSNAEVAAWIITARVILNLDEFITRE